jgi:poly(3-hydroxybutyrate) depolymerase
LDDKAKRADSLGFYRIAARPICVDIVFSSEKMNYLPYIFPIHPGESMIRASTLAVACLALLTGAQAQTSTVNMQFGGKSRSYILHLPAGGAMKPPLMIILHGFGMTAADQQNSVKMDGIADREKFIVAYPNAIDKNWDQAGDSDWKFILAVLDSIDAKHPIDKSRVYLAGFSQGAGMAHAGGCRYADRFAAVAPVSGNIPADCKPARAIPLFLTFGTKDIATPQKFMQSASTWAALDGCAATPTVIRPYPATNPNSLVTRIVWKGCRNGTEVIADSVSGGPHEWPMDTRTKVNNSEEAWTFFKDFSLDGTTAPRRAAFGTAARKGSVAFVQGVIRWDAIASDARVSVFDTGGRLVAEAPAGRGHIPFQGRPAGLYQVVAKSAGNASVFTLVVP